MTALSMLLFVLAVGEPSRQSEPAAQEPSPAQIHISHVMDAINGTPGGVGLLTILSEEAEIAARHAGLAASDPSNLESMQRHMHHVRHAVDPTTEDKGPGKGYGVLRAAEGVQTHSNLAARSEGATERIQQHAVHVATCAQNVVSWSKVILAESEKVLKATSAEEAAPSARKVEELTGDILNGTDANGDGQVSWQAEEGGIAQMRQHMQLMLSGEASSDPDP